MSPAEVRELLQRGTATIAFDTNAVFGSQVLELADLANAWGARTGTRVGLAVGVLPFIERQAKERRARGERFDPAVVEQSLKRKGVEIAVFDLHDAEAASEWLAGVAPTDAPWQALKLARTRRLAELPDDTLARLPATVDWFIAAHAAARGWLLVTADGGAEFAHVTCCTPDALRAALVDPHADADPPGS